MKGKTMTVQELIDDLMQIADKSLPVKTYDQDCGDWLDGGHAEDYGDFVGIR